MSRLLGKNQASAACRGTRWHKIALAAILGGTLTVPAAARAQDAAAAGEDAGAPGAELEDVYDAPFVEPDAPAEDEAAGGLDDPAATRSAPPAARPGWGDPDAPPPSSARAAPPEPAPERPRFWRMARNTVNRPLTLPQGVLRFDSILALSRFGSSGYPSGIFALAAGLFDELELGATPVIVTLTPWPGMGDPHVYARVRPFANDEVQLAARASVVIPTHDLEAQMGLAAELAWTANDWFRIDTGLDYQLLFSQPLHQRIGVPLTATFQLDSPNAIALTSGVYVFNDFDDVDVPLLAAWVFAWRGYQGPLGETRIEGGVTDLSDPENGWTIRARMTFFAYL
jgi:hypothetical protein